MADFLPNSLPHVFTGRTWLCLSFPAIRFRRIFSTRTKVLFHVQRKENGRMREKNNDSRSLAACCVRFVLLFYYVEQLSLSLSLVLGFACSKNSPFVSFCFRNESIACCIREKEKEKGNKRKGQIEGRNECNSGSKRRRRKKITIWGKGKEKGKEEVIDFTSNAGTRKGRES